MKPYAESCDQNREPILNVIAPLLQDCQTVLEIGSGTGQHAVYFGGELTHLIWQTSDRAEHHPGIHAWINDSGLTNVLPPLHLDTATNNWPANAFDAVYSANTVHIMSWEAVTGFFNGLGKILSRGGKFFLYGPFNYHGDFTSESNAHFDNWLKERDPASGIRDFEKLNEMAEEQGLTLIKDYTMPVNNRLLYWQKR